MCVLNGTQTQVNTDNVFTSNGIIELDPLIGPYMIIICSTPGQVYPGGSLLLESDPVLPVIPHNIIAPWPSHIGYFKFLQGFCIVFPETILVSKGRGRIVQISVQRVEADSVRQAHPSSAEVDRLHEHTVDPGIDLPDSPVYINPDHCCLSVKQERESTE